jgi:enterochelin esterase family protein
MKLYLSLLLPLALLAQPRPPALRSPEVHPDRTVTFRLAAPKATEVRLTGDLVKAPVALAKDEKGVWSATVGPLQPDLYGYRFSVDGITVTDPSNQGRPATMVAVPGDGPLAWDMREVPHGELHERGYTSKSVDTVRRIFVYKPPN